MSYAAPPPPPPAGYGAAPGYAAAVSHQNQTNNNNRGGHGGRGYQNAVAPGGGAPGGGGAAGGTGGPQHNAPPPKAPPPHLLASPMPLVNRSAENSNDVVPTVNRDHAVVIETSDGKLAVLSRAAGAKLPFVSKAVEEAAATPTPEGQESSATSSLIISFEYPLPVLNALYNWTEKFDGIKGGPAHPVPSPTNFIDFSRLLNDDWEKQYYEQALYPMASLLLGGGGAAAANITSSTAAPPLHGPTLVGTVRAADQYGIESLLHFALVALSCAVRGKSEEQVLALFGETASVSEEELAEVPKIHPWLPEVAKS